MMSIDSVKNWNEAIKLTVSRYFLKHNNIDDKPIPKFYPQLQGKVEAYNKIVKNELSL